jgi:hypothetical protein
MRKPWTNVAIFEDINTARALESFFRGKALESRIYYDKALQMFLFLCPPHLTWRVQVPGNSFYYAHELLEKNPPEILEQAIHCPSCGSLQVNYPQMTRKFLLPTILLHLGIIFRIIEHQCYCEKCRWMWSIPRSQTVTDTSAVKTAL